MRRADSGEYDMEVELTLFTSEEGGWTSGLSRFHASPDGPRIYVDGYECLAAFTLKEREWLYPGETAPVFVNVASPSDLIGKLFPGQHFLLIASQRPIGKGHVLSLLHLEEHAGKTHLEENETDKRTQNGDEKRSSIPPSQEKLRRRPRKKKRTQ